jgi:FkbM family methyltransferase
MPVKSLLKQALSRTPYRIVRFGGGNRFQAIEDVLINLLERGYQPSSVVDGGANTGEFTRLARRIWPATRIHMIEPQPSCRQALTALAQEQCAVFHATAIGDTNGVVRLAANPHETSTGAHILPDVDAAVSSAAVRAIDVPMTTLDALLGDALQPDRPCLLKLDLQGYELHALKGARSLLRAIDAVLTEVSFFAQSYEPSITELVVFLDAHGFELHDIAAVAGRRRDNRARQGDFLFVRRGSMLASDTLWS